MAKKSGKLARRYARALFIAMRRELGSAMEQADSEGRTPAQSVARELSNFTKLWSGNSELCSSLLNPMFERGERLEALLKVSDQIGLSKMAKRFLQVVFEKDRISSVCEIADAFARFADGEAGLVKVELLVANSVQDGEKSTIEASLAQQIGSSASFDWQVDPELLGGMIIRYQGRIIDGSLRGKLERIERAMTR